jgi:hypothetical protein
MTRTGLIAVVLVLLVGSAAAFAWTEKLKLEPAPVSKPEFDRHLSPSCGCRRATSHLSLLLRHSQDLDASVVDAEGNHVRTLVEGQHAPAGRVRLRWDGRGDNGQLVPDGIYRLRLRLHGDRRTILIPSAIHVDTKAPQGHVLGVQQTQSGPGLLVRYSSDETARALLLLDGEVVARGERHQAGDTRLRWSGPLPAGSHEVTLVLVDLAGNRSQPTQPVTVGG